MFEEARQVTIPLQVLLQWDDEGNDRQMALDLFDAFGSKEKTLHANMGGHTGVPQFEGDDGGPVLRPAPEVGPRRLQGSSRIRAPDRREMGRPEGRPISPSVGVAGFEPTTSSSRTKRATKLRHTPVERMESTGASRPRPKRVAALGCRRDTRGSCAVVPFRDGPSCNAALPEEGDPMTTVSLPTPAR